MFSVGCHVMAPVIGIKRSDNRNSEVSMTDAMDINAMQMEPFSAEE
jgi:hypothetical protein